MTARDRSVAEAYVAKFGTAFGQSEAPVIPTAELNERLRRNEPTVLVDVRAVEEQRVSMIPGAVTREVFEAEVLPTLKGQQGPGPLVVPYCTVGFRSATYCRDLMRDHGLHNVKNGEGIVMWTFDGDYLVRPLPGNTVTRAAPMQAIALDDASPRASDEGKSIVYGKRVADSTAHTDAVHEVHVYGPTWNCAAEGFTTVYFSSSHGIWKYVLDRCRNSKTIRTVAPWALTFALFYMCFTPMCGAMYHCGCRLAFSKWGQVETCNIYDNTAAHRCPWCTCSGFSCIFVSSDTKAFSGIFLLDILPDGFFVATITILVLYFSFARVEKTDACLRRGSGVCCFVKVLISVLWFFSYCLLMGGILFAAHSDYPYFLGIERT